MVVRGTIELTLHQHLQYQSNGTDFAQTLPFRDVLRMILPNDIILALTYLSKTLMSVLSSPAERDPLDRLDDLWIGMTVPKTHLPLSVTEKASAWRG